MKHRGAQKAPSRDAAIACSTGLRGWDVEGHERATTDVDCLSSTSAPDLEDRMDGINGLDSVRVVFPAFHARRAVMFRGTDM